DLKMLMLQGSFHRSDYEAGFSSTARYSLDFLLGTPPEKLFSFSVKEEVVQELKTIAATERRRYGDGHKYKSEEMLSFQFDIK
ncbi:MAG: hypothetical protein II688_07490, partial [Lachnospiraceae bacterium]|nr:hypothetical protein [Lachnospiraceae bacterium]